MSAFLRFFALCSVLAIAAPALQAQAVYRIVGPDGKVTFSDQPPPSNAPVKSATALGAAAPGGARNAAALPLELRQVVSKYPVTLLSGANCGPCNSGRALLIGRGVPFTEKTVASNEDIDALRRLSNDSTLPLLTIGSQQLSGFSDAEWTQFLDAAGYPKTSQLPAGYSNPPATPLVAVKKPELPADAPPAAAAGPANALPPPSAGNPGSNPAGIRF